MNIRVSSLFCCLRILTYSQQPVLCYTLQLFKTCSVAISFCDVPSSRLLFPIKRLSRHDRVNIWMLNRPHWYGKIKARWNNKIHLNVNTKASYSYFSRVLMISTLVHHYWKSWLSVISTFPLSSFGFTLSSRLLLTLNLGALIQTYIE